MSTPTNNPSPNSDGESVSVIHRDGRTEQAFVRILSRAELPQYAEFLVSADCDETRECAFYCRRDVLWANSLTMERPSGRRARLWLNWSEAAKEPAGDG